MAADDDFTRLSGMFTVIAVLFGLLFLSVAFGIAKIARMQQWPAVLGVVIKQAPQGWYDETQQRRYYLEYAYEIDGRRYTGTRFHIREEAVRGDNGLGTNYRIGDAITVYCNPANPAEAVLNRDYLRDAFVFLLVIGGFLLLAGTMILKEARWRQLTRDLLAAIPPTYDGGASLPDSTIVADTGSQLQLRTGPSIFWTLGIPFAIVSFVGGTAMLLMLNELNRGWALSVYGGWILATWATGILGAVIMMSRQHTLTINVPSRTLREEIRWFGGRRRQNLDFDAVGEIRLYREKWRHDNPLRNWMMFIQTKTGYSLTISRGFRDIQPASRIYLDVIKKRMEHLIGRFP